MGDETELEVNFSESPPTHKPRLALPSQGAKSILVQILGVFSTKKPSVNTKGLAINRKNKSTPTPVLKRVFLVVEQKQIALFLLNRTKVFNAFVYRKPIFCTFTIPKPISFSGFALINNELY